MKLPPQLSRLAAPSWWYLVVIALAVLTRFWRLFSLFHWTLDEEYWAYVAYNIATGYHVPLIGGPIGGTGVYTGPLFVWLLAPYFWLTGGHPYALAFGLSFLGVITTYLVYRLFRSILGPPSALIAAAAYAGSTLAALYDRKFWNASLTPILSLLSVYLIFRSRSRPQPRLAIALAALAALAVHAHMTGLTVLVFIVASSLLYRLPRRWQASFWLTFISLQLPLLLFDLRHDWLNSRAFLALFASSSPGSGPILTPLFEVAALTSRTFARLLYTPARDIAQELTLCSQLAAARQLPNLFVHLISGALFLSGLAAIRRRNPLALMLWINLLLVVAYRFLSPASFYPGQLSEYYFLPSFIPFFLLAGQTLYSLSRRFFLPLASLGLFFLVINLHTSLNLTHSQGVTNKLAAVAQVTALAGNTPYSLEVTGHPCQIFGYRYLLTLAGRDPAHSYLDPRFGWLYQRRQPDETPRIHLVIDADSARIKVQDVEISPPPATQDPNP